MRLTTSSGQTSPEPAETFTGTVYVDDIRTPGDGSALGCAHVRLALLEAETVTVDVAPRASRGQP